MPDAYVTAFLLRECLRKKTVDELIEISSRPALLTKVSFGKHRGIAWKSVDRGYLQWILKQGDMDENVLFTARYWLNGGRA
jgi:exodeoxyribonuclease X